jgi:hypothetical protein
MRGPSQRSAGCDRQAWQHNLWLPKGLQPGGEVELTLAYKPSSGLATRYKLSVPTHYSGIVSWPLLVGFHGWGGSGSHSLDAFHAHGKAAGYIVDASTRFRLTEGCIDLTLRPIPSQTLTRYIVASPDGFAEDVGLGSWNGAGTTSSPGPEGPTCHDPNRTFADYCYASCRRYPYPYP